MHLISSCFQCSHLEHKDLDFEITVKPKKMWNSITAVEWFLELCDLLLPGQVTSHWRLWISAWLLLVKDEIFFSFLNAEVESLEARFLALKHKRRRYPRIRILWRDIMLQHQFRFRCLEKRRKKVSVFYMPKPVHESHELTADLAKFRQCFIGRYKIYQWLLEYSCAVKFTLECQYHRYIWILLPDLDAKVFIAIVFPESLMPSLG